MTNMNSTFIAVVLDRSGSMECVRKDTIGGFNKLLEENQKLPGEARLMLVQFDDQYEVMYDGIIIKLAAPLTMETFVPRGWTALHDAVGKTIETMGKRLAGMKEAERPGRVIVVIITDGGENHSFSYTAERVKSMVEEQKSKYAWEFLFVGANQDAWLNAANIGILRDKALNYQASEIGTQNAFYTATKSVSKYRSGLSASFDAEDRALNESK